jgi:hypothetical protein
VGEILAGVKVMNKLMGLVCLFASQ